MESTSARELDRRLADLVRSERNLVVQFVVELAGFARRELYRELGYTSLFYYCVRQLGLSKSSAYRRSEVSRLIARLPVIGEQLAGGRLSIRALVELREVLTEENHVEVLARTERRRSGIVNATAARCARVRGGFRGNQSASFSSRGRQAADAGVPPPQRHRFGGLHGGVGASACRALSPVPQRGLRISGAGRLQSRYRAGSQAKGTN